MSQKRDQIRALVAIEFQLYPDKCQVFASMCQKLNYHEPSIETINVWFEAFEDEDHQYVLLCEIGVQMHELLDAINEQFSHILSILITQEFQLGHGKLKTFINVCQIVGYQTFDEKIANEWLQKLHKRPTNDKPADKYFNLCKVIVLEFVQFYKLINVSNGSNFVIMANQRYAIGYLYPYVGAFQVIDYYHARIRLVSFIFYRELITKQEKKNKKKKIHDPICCFFTQW